MWKLRRMIAALEIPIHFLLLIEWVHKYIPERERAREYGLTSCLQGQAQARRDVSVHCYLKSMRPRTASRVSSEYAKCFRVSECHLLTLGKRIIEIRKEKKKMNLVGRTGVDSV